MFLLIRRIVESVSRIEDISLLTRKRHIVKARQIYFYLCKKYTKATSISIGKTMDKDHATVLHAVKAVRDLIDTNDEYVEWIIKSKNILYHKLKDKSIDINYEALDVDGKILKIEELEFENKQLKKRVNYLEMQIMLEKQESIFKSKKYSEMEEYLSKIPLSELSNFYETRVIPFAKMHSQKTA